MTQYIIKTLVDDYYGQWFYQGFVSHLSPEAIVKLAKERIKPVTEFYEITLAKRNAICDQYPEAVLDSDFPEGTFDECDIDDKKYNQLRWVECNSNTGFYIDPEDREDCIGVVTLQEYYDSICRNPPTE